MSPRITGATASRVLRQLRRDPRTIALLLLVPCVLVILLHELFADRPQMFQQIGVPMLGLFPLDQHVPRHLDHDAARAHVGNARAAADDAAHEARAPARLRASRSRLVAVVQASLVSLVGVRPARPGSARTRRSLIVVLAVANAILGMAFGLFVSAFAQTEFQAVQFMPAFVLPQILLCGLFVPRDQMADWLRVVSDALAADLQLRRALPRRPRRHLSGRGSGSTSAVALGGDAARARARRGDAPAPNRLGGLAQLASTSP